MKPFLKWAGNKFPIRDKVIAALNTDPSRQRLIEPFTGSGAMFLATNYRAYLLGDANADLITLYTQLKDHEDAVLREVTRLFAQHAALATQGGEAAQRALYLRLRREFNGEARATAADAALTAPTHISAADPGDASRDACTLSPDEQTAVRRAALFVYLNRHGFNGLCRYNGHGKFNVPYGRPRQPYLPLTEMAAFGAKARQTNAQFRHADFLVLMDEARRGDVVYCDPPYEPLTATANFTGYATDTFGVAQQEALAAKAVALASPDRPGGAVTVVISNHNTPRVLDWYRHATEIQVFDVQRFISAKATSRTKAPELLAVFRAGQVSPIREARVRDLDTERIWPSVSAYLADVAAGTADLSLQGDLFPTETADDTLVAAD